MFDHLYAVADGKCIYQGSIKGLIPYLAESELVCPTYHNPADYRKCFITNDERLIDVTLKGRSGCRFYTH